MKTGARLSNLVLVIALGAQCAASAQSYTFSTIAGAPGVPGAADGSGTEARFSSPAGLTIDASGNLYVVEDGNHTVRKLTPNGDGWLVSTIAGSPGESGSADGSYGVNRLFRPRGIAVDSAGNLFITDSYNSTIRQLHPEGANYDLQTLAGMPGVLEHADGTYTNALFRRPTGISVDPFGRLMVADMNNHVIRQLDPVEEFWSSLTIAGDPFYAGWSNGVGYEAEFATPYGVVAASESLLFVADTGNNGIRQMLWNGVDWVVSTIAGELNAPSGSADGLGVEARFYFPVGIAWYPPATLFVTDQLNHTIRKLTLTEDLWTVTTIGGVPGTPGTTDGAGSLARFQRPWGIAVDTDGALYIADLRNHTIRRGVPATSPTAPSLAWQFASSTLTLSWPISAANYLLETADPILIPLAWSEVSQGITSNSESFSFSQPVDGTARLFRLRQR